MRVVTMQEHTYSVLGHSGEALAVQARFPVAEAFRQTYGEGTFALLLLRPGETEPRAMVVSVEDGDVVWNVSREATEKPGFGVCELSYFVGQTLAKSEKYPVRILDALGEPAEDPPEAWHDWVENVLSAAADIRQSAGGTGTGEAVRVRTVDCTELRRLHYAVHDFNGAPESFRLRPAADVPGLPDNPLLTLGGSDFFPTELTDYPASFPFVYKFAVLGRNLLQRMNRSDTVADAGRTFSFDGETGVYTCTAETASAAGMIKISSFANTEMLSAPIILRAGVRYYAVGAHLNVISAEDYRMYLSGHLPWNEAGEDGGDGHWISAVDPDGKTPKLTVIEPESFDRIVVQSGIPLFAGESYLEKSFYPFLTSVREDAEAVMAGYVGGSWSVTYGYSDCIPIEQTVTLRNADEHRILSKRMKKTQRTLLGTLETEAEPGGFADIRTETVLDAIMDYDGFCQGFAFCGIYTGSDGQYTSALPEHCFSCESSIALASAEESVFDTLDSKQDRISDLDAIRAGAQAGATALQAMTSQLVIRFGHEFAGKPYTVSGGENESYSGTVPSSLTVRQSVKGLETDYTVSCESDEETYTNTIMTGSCYGLYKTVLLHIVPWETGTDEQIADIVSALDEGLITAAETGWGGDQKRTVHLAAMPAEYVGESHAAQDATLVIMDTTFQYDLVNGGKSHFIIGLEHCLNEPGYMNSTDTNAGSWDGSARRTWCNEVFRNALPEAIRGCFKQFKVITAKEHNYAETKVSNDYFSLFALKETDGTRSSSNSYEANALSIRTWYTAPSHRKKLIGSAYGQWLTRSPVESNSTGFCCQSSSGSPTTASASTALGISPFGCI